MGDLKWDVRVRLEREACIYSALDPSKCCVCGRVGTNGSHPGRLWAMSGVVETEGELDFEKWIDIPPHLVEAAAIKAGMPERLCATPMSAILTCCELLPSGGFRCEFVATPSRELAGV